MKFLLALLVFCFLSVSFAARSSGEAYLVNGQSKSKLEAIKALINNPDTEVYKCQLVQLTDKVTLKKKSSKSE